MELLAAILGLATVGWVLWDVFQSVVVPRPAKSRYRIARNLTRWTWRLTRWWALRLHRRESREGLLGTFAPMLVLLLLVTWIAFLLLGFGLVTWAIRDEFQPIPSTLGEAVYTAGVALLTIGYGDYDATGGAARVLMLLSAGTGLGVVALTITYLFSLYGAFQRRELLVVTLDARAGAPPSGVSLLETHQRLGMMDDLPKLFTEWEVWAAQVLDSHLAYPILTWFRSSHDNESWVGSLGAVLDAAVLVLTAVDDVPRAPAALMFAMGEHLAEDVGNFLGFEVGDEPGVERREFEQARERLAAAGYHLTEPEMAWRQFVSRRGHYAHRLNLFAAFWVTPPAQWIGDRSPMATTTWRTRRPRRR
jgi:Ion channel